MKPNTPALNGLEQAAFTLTAVIMMAEAVNYSPLAKDAMKEAIYNFAKMEADYLGLEPDFANAVANAKALCEGL